MISCKEYHDRNVAHIKEQIEGMSEKPSLCIIQVGDNEASNRYVRNKVKDCEEVGIVAKVDKAPEWYTERDIYDLIHNRNTYTGIIVQMPLPDSIDTEAVKQMIPYQQDVDGFGGRTTPCTPRGILDWLSLNDIDLDGKNVTIFGRSDIVGKPLAELMNKHNATVTLCHSHTKNIKEHIKYADIIVSAVGKKGFLTKDIMRYCEKRPRVIDVGINFDESGKLCGDCSKDLQGYRNMAYVTPVPKGVGLLTRTAMLDNLLDLYRENR